MEEFPSPMMPIASRSEVFVTYLDFFRSAVIGRVEQLSESELRASRVPTGWTPLELLRHLAFVEMRWLEWGFEGQPVEDPWGDNREGKWFVDESESRDDLIGQLRAQGFRTRKIIRANDLEAVGKPSPRWDGAEPATLERILFHLLQEYARHLGHLDIVAELSGGLTEESA
jgi:uncharacterized damage-inducible protein DinB